MFGGVRRDNFPYVKTILPKCMRPSVILHGYGGYGRREGGIFYDANNFEDDFDKSRVCIHLRFQTTFGALLKCFAQKYKLLLLNRDR